MTSLATRDPAREAENIRLSVWGHQFPVDPVQIARGLGIGVRRAPLSEDVSGALRKQRGQDPVILLNDNDHPNRQRFTCAHELGHFVSRTSQADEYEYVDLRDTIWSATSTDPEEVFANKFAANLLMPEKDVRALASSSALTPTSMAAYFDVSLDSMSSRLKDLKIAA